MISKMFTKDRLPVLILLFLAGVINYLDRSALSIGAPFIKEIFHYQPHKWELYLVVFLLDMLSLILSAEWRLINTGQNLLYSLP